MNRAVFVAGLVLLAAGPVYAERLWLVVAASSSSPAEIAKSAKQHAARAEDGLVVQVSDCGDTKKVFAWVTHIAMSGEDAQLALSRARATVSDAYVKRCETRPGTLLSLRMTAVDPSIADVPEDAVNWSDTDRVSIARSLPDGRTIVIARYYAKTEDDPLGGRRERVILVESGTKRLVLTDNCISPGPFATSKGLIAFSCAREQAADHLLHAVLVFDETGRKVKEVERCRNPKWGRDASLTCEAESVDANGRLKLTTQQVSL